VIQAENSMVRGNVLSTYRKRGEVISMARVIHYKADEHSYELDLSVAHEIDVIYVRSKTLH
jgi:hypothetical protein